MNEKYIRYLPKFEITPEVEEYYKKYEEILKNVKELQPYISVDPEKFPGFEYVADSKEKVDRKLNLRVRQHDVYLLDSIAKFLEVSRSSLINYILYRYFLSQLNEIEEQDARTLLAHLADRRAYYDPEEQPWTHDVLEKEFESVLQTVLSGGVGFMYETPDSRNSVVFDGIMKKIKETVKK